mmetsp:Transcript_9332/g.16078  ORF Transcript_9332/g.16078 Transcript_9332/m.16078 type:complete len:284 (-) Transcript_9332:836-1687(-)
MACLALVLKHIFNWVLLIALFALSFGVELLPKSTDRWFQSDDPAIALDYKAKQLVTNLEMNIYIFVIVAVVYLVYTPLLKRLPQNNASARVCPPITNSYHWLYRYYQGLALVMTIVEIGKYYADSLRPDFLDRCQLSSTAVPIEATGRESTYSISDCTGANHLVVDGRKSFPSGHAAYFLYAGVSLAFMFYTVHIRPRRAAGDDVHFHWFLWAAVPILFASIVIASRLGDHRHRVADLTTGAVLGVAAAAVCIAYIYPPLPPSALHSESRDAPLLSKTVPLSV